MSVVSGGNNATERSLARGEQCGSSLKNWARSWGWRINSARAAETCAESLALQTSASLQATNVLM
ncbi:MULTISPECIES: hypothetical protein [unclassified Variovorax]|jgi:hypothetical protein|uniref:hypothetical protein n=1 Tax=unclassified Variovorax TaxID=663243 RepID=UPI0008397512|nr:MULTISPECIES: hypothetical protein [unclassified Variovorax]